MNDTNVIEHHTAIWDRLQRNAAQEKRHGDDARALWPVIAADMAALRAKYKSNQEFGAALALHEIEYNKNDRAAFVWMGALKPEALRDALATCDSRSPKHFRSEVESWGDGYFAECSPRGEHATEEAPEPQNTPETAPEPAETPVETEAESEIQEESVKLPRMDSRNLLFKMMGQDIAEKISAQWTNKITRISFGTLARAPGGKKAVKRIADMIDDYCAAPNAGQYNTATNGTPTNSFSHRVFFPEIPATWARHYGCTWDKPRAVNAILDEIDDANRMMEELGAGASFEDCNAWWKTRGRKADPAQCKAPDTSAFDSPESQDYSIKPKVGAESEEIVVHGQVIWPSDSGRYTFDEAWAAYQLWNDEDRYVAQFEPNAAARGRHFMPLRAWLERVSHGFAAAWHKIATAQHNNPDKASETKAPSRHFNAQ